ncbi:nervous system development [Seminavis robusta]|uniref:Nervous system development n=1 Tax=Seminavis robusta TaxID=568900 RepID=A0A9N8DD84_9STRA|nr:nervous system development [Seminavis robusta]|eukprot:Sro65_g037010.1 nervous system development (491) ;mRNA; r:130477-132017
MCRSTTLTTTSDDRYDYETPWDEEGPPPEDREVPGWRGDPSETHSDWTIEIVARRRNGNDEVQVYHVHKYLLSCGQRSSSYFAKLFQSSFAESQACTSRIELDPLAAKAFPNMLDFLYYGTHYFGMRWMRWHVKEFVGKDVSLGTLDVYYRHAKLFHNQEMLDILTRYIGQNFLEIPPTSSIVKTVDPRLWLGALEWTTTNDKNFATDQRNDDDKATAISLHWSQIVSEMDIQDMDLALWEELTAVGRMPVVNTLVALDLCQLEERVRRGHDNANQDAGRNITSLQERCTTALSKTWDLVASGDKETRKLLEDQTPSFLVDLNEKTLKESQKDLEGRYEAMLMEEKLSHKVTRGKLSKEEQKRRSAERLAILARDQAVKAKLELERLKLELAATEIAVKQAQEYAARNATLLLQSELDELNWTKRELRKARKILRRIRVVPQEETTYIGSGQLPMELIDQLVYTEQSQKALLYKVQGTYRPLMYYSNDQD